MIFGYFQLTGNSDFHVFLAISSQLEITTAKLFLATLVAIAIVDEKLQMTFPIKLLSQF